MDLGFDDRLDKPSLFDKMSQDSTETFIFVLGIFLCVFTSIQVLGFLFKYIPSVYSKAMFEFNDEAEKEISPNVVKKLKSKYFLKSIGRIFLDARLYYNLACLALALLGIIIHPLFFTFHLLSVIFMYQKLIDVLQAFWGPITEIILTLVFFLIIVYIFAVIGYVCFAEMYPDYTCYSLFSCFIITLDQTFKNNGGFGAYMDPISTPNDIKEEASFNIGRLIFDQLSNFVLLILIMQILAGLIIDKFGEIRENSENMEEELKSSCIVCGEDADVVERRTGETFDYHKEQVHNLWYYILYIGYLRKKPKDEFNAMETRIHDLFKTDNVEWFPYSLSRGKDNSEITAEISEKLKIINKLLSEED